MIEEYRAKRIGAPVRQGEKHASKRESVWLAVALFMVIAFCGCNLSFVSQEEKESAPPEKKPPDAVVTLYLPNNNADGFVTKAAITDGLAAQIISLLVSEKALPEGCALLEFAIDGNGSGIKSQNAKHTVK